MGSTHSYLLLPIPIVRKRKLSQIVDEAAESAPRKKLKTYHNNSAAELDNMAPESEDSSELEVLTLSPDCPSSRGNSPAEPRDNVAKRHQSPQLEQLHSVSKDGTNHDNSGAQLHDATEEDEQPPQPENLHSGLTSNTYFSNSAAQLDDSVGDKQPQQLEQLSVVSENIIENTNAVTRPPDTVTKDQQPQRQEQLMSVSGHNATDSNSVTEIHQTVQKGQPRQQGQLASVSKHNVTDSNITATTKATQRNAVAKAKPRSSKAAAKPKRVRSKNTAKAKTTRRNIANQSSVIESNIIAQTQGTQSTSDTQTNETAMPRDQLQQPKKLNLDPRYETPAIQSNSSSNIGAPGNAASAEREVAAIMGLFKDDADMNSLFERVRAGREVKKANLEISSALNLPGTVVESPVTYRAKKFLTPHHIRDYWKTIPKYQPNLLGLPLHIQFIIFREVLKHDRKVEVLERDREALDRDRAVLECDREALERDREAVESHGEVLERDGEVDIFKRDQEILKRDQEILKREREILKRDRDILEYDGEVRERERAEIYPHYCRGYQPAEPEYHHRELWIIKEKLHESSTKFFGRANVDLPNLTFVNKYFHNICSQIFYSTKVFIFNDARSCIWFFRKLGESKVRQIRNVVFNISSGFFLSKELRTKHDVCEEERWCQIFHWLRGKQCFQNCLIRFYGLKSLRHNDKLSEEDKQRIHDNRVNLPFYIGQLRGIQKARIENHQCKFLAYQEMEDVVKEMTLPHDVGLAKYKKRGPQGDCLVRHEEGLIQNFYPEARRVPRED